MRDYRLVRFALVPVAAVFTAIAMLPTAAYAQPKLAVLKGIVLTDSSELPIRGADISVPRLRLTTTSALDGSFRLAGVAPGREIVMVKRIGFMPVTTTLNFAPGDSIDTDFILVPSVQTLPGVRVKGRAFDRKFAEYERRKAEGFGRFLDTEQLDKMQARLLAEVLTTIPGPQIYRSNVSSAAWIASSRGQQSINDTSAAARQTVSATRRSSSTAPRSSPPSGASRCSTSIASPRPASAPSSITPAPVRCRRSSTAAAMPAVP